jgi:uncharacterized protein (TIGR02466 family)
MSSPPVTGNIVHLFATRVLQKVWPDTGALNDALHRIVVARRNSTKTTKRTNVGGWQSTHDLLKWGDPEIGQLGQMINAGFGEMMESELGTGAFQCSLSAVAWANVNTDGDYNRIHTHGDSHISGVYYVSMGEPDPSRSPNGAFEFLDPRISAGMPTIPGVPVVTGGLVTPVPGMMIVFPSWLAHGVLPFFGAGERISIAFNIKVNNLKLDQGATKQ